MDARINPPSLATLASGWLRGGISVVLSIGVMVLFSSLLFRGGFFALSPYVLAFSVVAWTVLVVVQSLFDHTATVTSEHLEVRTWVAALLGLPGRSFPLQEPRLSIGRGPARGGGGLTGTRMSLVDEHGLRHNVIFMLISFDKLEGQVAQISRNRSAQY